MAKLYVVLEGDTRLADARDLRPPTGPVSFNGQRASGLADPTSASDAATKGYTDALAQGLSVKPSARAATTINVAALSGLPTVDGVTLVDGDRLLVKDQSGGSAQNNGLWIVHSGAWTRAVDADTSAELVGAFVFIEEGTVNAGSGWVMTTPAPIVVGTTALVWTQFSGAGEIVAGPGIAKTGNTLSQGGATVPDQVLKEWTSAEAYEATAVTYDGTHTATVSLATVKWPDGSSGTFTTDAINPTFETVDAYHIVHAASGKTVTQAAVTRDGTTGFVTVKPALTVA